ncbi:hypothetical protein CONCODRAFT_19028 [Conidiobolus coronatus NRRL 28638]|uniref:Uncharacterized protein n=1 Tax=Conidiobolus coronatus (strain ATCC 28846 / CBS 209.66 / NRRL 28638) TaxID=796925 RepID=A0A137P021_CONC2|nr:hypothetical protein CONCODRAFT_19028 [Conidiobolus coronatus NRRL 28638]|eukprot:KXN68342.1 hypothetical protein CONCODRAFT_19028 [Conidiobolus coronatus NRRL 28638]
MTKYKHINLTCQRPSYLNSVHDPSNGFVTPSQHMSHHEVHSQHPIHSTHIQSAPIHPAPHQSISAPTTLANLQSQASTPNSTQSQPQVQNHTVNPALTNSAVDTVSAAQNSLTLPSNNGMTQMINPHDTQQKRKSGGYERWSQSDIRKVLDWFKNDENFTLWSTNKDTGLQTLLEQTQIDKNLSQLKNKITLMRATHRTVRNKKRFGNLQDKLQPGESVQAGVIRLCPHFEDLEFIFGDEENNNINESKKSSPKSRPQQPIKTAIPIQTSSNFINIAPGPIQGVNYASSVKSRKILPKPDRPPPLNIQDTLQTFSTQIHSQTLILKKLAGAVERNTALLRKLIERPTPYPLPVNYKNDAIPFDILGTSSHDTTIDGLPLPINQNGTLPSDELNESLPGQLNDSLPGLN